MKSMFMIIQHGCASSCYDRSLHSPRTKRKDKMYTWRLNRGARHTLATKITAAWMNRKSTQVKIVAGVIARHQRERASNSPGSGCRNGDSGILRSSHHSHPQLHRCRFSLMFRTSSRSVGSVRSFNCSDRDVRVPRTAPAVDRGCSIQILMNRIISAARLGRKQCWKVLVSLNIGNEWNEAQKRQVWTMCGSPTKHLCVKTHLRGSRPIQRDVDGSLTTWMLRSCPS